MSFVKKRVKQYITDFIYLPFDESIKDFSVMFDEYILIEESRLNSFSVPEKNQVLKQNNIDINSDKDKFNYV